MNPTSMRLLALSLLALNVSVSDVSSLPPPTARAAEPSIPAVTEPPQSFFDAIPEGDRDAARKFYKKHLDVKGLSLCGLALCGDPVQIPAAKAAYSAARAVTSEAGITRAVLQRFDALAQADTDGILADVRPVAAGVKPG